MSLWLPHHVTVSSFEYSGDVEFSPILKFECPWLYGDCHFYPTCSCESWDIDHFKDYGPGHERQHHTECWMQAWFDNDGAVYQGEDMDDMRDNCLPWGMNRSGEIETTHMDEWLEWEFKETP